MADSLGRDARRELVELVVDGLGRRGPRAASSNATTRRRSSASRRRICARLPAGPGPRRVAVALANREFLLAAFAALGDARREALHCRLFAWRCRAFDAGVSEAQVLDSVLPCLSAAQLVSSLTSARALHARLARRRELAARRKRRAALRRCQFHC
jgi:hypothetical protein